MAMRKLEAGLDRACRQVALALVGALGLVVALAPVGARATDTDGAEAPPALRAAIDKVVADGVPGVIALERQGREVFHATSGVRNLSTGSPIAPEDRFRVGSITKSFVSTVVLQLVGEGRLSLDDSVERWLPGLVPNG